MHKKITIRHGTGTRVIFEDIPATSKGLKQIFDASSLRPGEYTITITCEGLSEEGKINFIAMWQKALKHMRFILGVTSSLPVQRSQIWRKYFRNKVDTEHGQGRNFEDFITYYLENFLQNLSYGGDSFSITGRFASAPAIAAAVGRIVNMLRWCEQWTQAIKLVSEAGMTWVTFNKLTLDGEQPIVRRRK